MGWLAVSGIRRTELAQHAAADDDGEAGGGHQQELADDGGIEVVAQVVLDNARGDVEDKQQENAGEEALERDEVEHPSRLANDDADAAGEDKRAEGVGLGLAEDLDSEQHADEADRECRGG